MTARRASGPTSILNFRVTDEERAELEARAAREGTTVSTTVRRSLFGGDPGQDRQTVRPGALDEDPRLVALAARAGVSADALVRQWLDREHQAQDFVEARPGPAPVGWYPARRHARHVFTLHHVPGRAEPLCVRRRTLGRCDSYDVEFARGRVASAWGDDLDDDGTTSTLGSSSSDRGDEAARVYADGRVLFDLEPHFEVYLEPPSPEERRAWRERRSRQQAALRRLRRDGYIDVWRVVAPELPGPARAVKRRAFRTKWVDHRGDLHVVDEPREQAQFWESGFGLDEVNLFKLAGAGRQLSATGPTRGNTWTPAEEVLYLLEEPTAEQLAEEGRAAWADAVRERRVWQRASRAREEDAGRESRGRPTVAIEEDLRWLGLTWPCTEADVRKAQRRKTFEVHTDRGATGDDAALRRTIAAADALLRWMRARAA